MSWELSNNNGVIWNEDKGRGPSFSGVKHWEWRPGNGAQGRSVESVTEAGRFSCTIMMEWTRDAPERNTASRTVHDYMAMQMKPILSVHMKAACSLWDLECGICGCYCNCACGEQSPCIWMYISMYTVQNRISTNVMLLMWDQLYLQTWCVSASAHCFGFRVRTRCPSGQWGGYRRPWL